MRKKPHSSSMPWRERKGDGNEDCCGISMDTACVFYQAVPATQQTKTTASLEEQVLLVELREPGKAHHQFSCRLHHYIAGAHSAEHAVHQMLVSLLCQDDFCVIGYQDKKTWVFWKVCLMSVCVWDEPGKKELGSDIFSLSCWEGGKE